MVSRSPSKLYRGRPYAVYTPGVLSCSDRISSAVIRRDIAQIREAGLLPLYYAVEQEDEKFSDAAADSGADVVPLGALRWKEVVPILSEAETVVSGRYHINIFAALANVAFVPLESNTPKMQGLLEHLSVPTSFVRSWKSEETVPLKLDQAVRVAPDVLERCAALARLAAPVGTGLSGPSA